ncbi:unnamed protein product [Paramecium pentaurelia]|uniref:GPR180/TMEM145 transmembrane domain-containing protein n=1 Tax=Paramecium pentaurelia TaxID=43138 RepID=A0A8S1RZH1_9CILI|nr:unnamed protein product [Paramecium pentaurelia]
MFIIVLIVLAFTQAKQITQTFTIKQLQKQQYIPINRFGSKGIVNYKIQSRIIKPPKDYENRQLDIAFDFFQQDSWQLALKRDECSRQQEANKVVHQSIQASQDQKISINEGQLSFGKYHNVWIAVFNNCQHNIDKVIKLNNKNTKLEITIWFYEEGGQEFSLEEQGLLNVVGILTFVTIIGFIYNYRIFKSEVKKHGEWDYAYLFVLVVIGLEAIQNLINFIHLIVYNFNGKGIGAFSTISEIIQIVDNYLLMVLLILLAWGWSIEFMNMEDWDIYGSLAFLIAFAQALIVGLGRLVSNQTDYHIYEGWVGYIISVIYITLAIYFYYSVTQRKKKGDSIDNFYFQLKIYGMLFFLAFPTFLFISKLVDPYKSYKIIIMGNMLIRMLNMVLMARLFTGKSSDYQKICIKGKSFLDRGKFL